MPFPTETANPSEIGQLAGVAVLIDKSDAGRGVSSSAGLIGLSTLDEVLQQTQAMLLQFSQRQDFDQLMIVAFGENHDVAIAELFFQKLAQGNDVLPRVELIDGDSLNGAYGVYSQANDTVYLSRIFVEAGNLEALTGVLIEEFGHGIDARVNAIDTVGDEGDIFSRLVRQQPIDEESLRFLKMEDDHAQVTIDGVSFTVEQSQDFNQDSQMDILWRNYATGQNGVWLMNGTTQVGWNPVSPVADANWRIEGTGDFNQDGQTDILWRHYGTGQVGAWLMNGSQSLGWAQIGVVQDLNWRIEGTGDFNQDGKTDLVWRHYGSGQVGTWLMNGVQYQAWADLGMVQDSNWRIDGVGDFNQDGKSDLIWRHYGSGQVGAWIMSGTQIQSWAQIGVVQDSNWRIEGTADFNQDGHTDLLWRHYGSGQVGAWLMNGNIYQSWRDLGVVADPNWQPVMSAYSDMRPTVTIAATDNVAAEASAGQATNIGNIENWTGVPEPSNPGRFTLSRTGNLTNALSVSYTLRGSAANGIDYNALTGRVTFLAGVNQAIIDINPIDDFSLEETETITIDLTADSGYRLGAATSATLSILDNDVDLTIQGFSAPTSSVVGDLISISSYTKNNGSVATKNHITCYWLSNDSVAESSDDIFLGYKDIGALNGGAIGYSTHNFTYNSAWGTGPKYIIAVADGDNIFYETNESNNTSVSLINIYDKPLISIATTDSSATETNIGETINPGRFTLNRTGGNIATPLSVNYNMTGSATNGIDYSNLTGAVTFAAGSNQAIIDINPINESSIENTETVIVTLLSNSAYTLGSVATASLSITDNDVDITGQISLSQTSATIGDSITVGSYSVNNGFTTVSPTYVRYWLSNYTNLESSPNTNILLGQNPLLPLGPGVSRYDSVNFVYNESWGYGAKYIAVRIDL
jgi:CARDB/Calx-beta domain/FG-GAP-like repeat